MFGPSVPALASHLLLKFGEDPVLSISDKTGPFTLNFSNFLKDSVSNTETVVYEIRANNLSAGSVAGTVSARIDSLMQDMNLEADVAGYENIGHDDFSNLQEAESGYIAVTASNTALANKVPGSGTGDNQMEGNLTVNWRGKLTTDAPFGQQSRSLIVTIKEGN